MNTKKFTSTLVALVLALGIVSGFNYVFAVSYSAPTDTFPNCSSSNPACNTPVNIGTTDQAKNGGLAVNAFTAYLGSEFKQTLLVDGNLTAAQNVTVNSLSNSVDHTVCVDPAGKLILCSTPGGVTVSASYNQSLAVSGIAGFTQSPSPTSNSASGTHTSFTGPINVSVTGSNIYSGSQVDLVKNGVVLQCYSTGSPRTFSFSSYSYSLSDSISINSVTGQSNCL